MAKFEIKMGNLAELFVGDFEDKNLVINDDEKVGTIEVDGKLIMKVVYYSTKDRERTSNELSKAFAIFLASYQKELAKPMCKK